MDGCSRVHDRLDEVVRGLASTNSHVVLDSFMGEEAFTGARAELLSLLDMDHRETAHPPKFKLGELAGDDGYWTTKTDTAKRSDFVYWMTEGELQANPDNLRFLGRFFESARRLGLDILEWSKSPLGRNAFPLQIEAPNDPPPSLSCDRMMLAAYPTSTPSRFTLHVDNPNRNGRVLTFTYYLNPQWDSDEFGGELLLALPSGPKKVDPIGDRLVIFFADARVPHEVLPTKQSPKAPAYRLSIAMWLSYLSPQQVLETYKGSFASWIAAIKKRRMEEGRATVETRGKGPV